MLRAWRHCIGKDTGIDPRDEPIETVRLVGPSLAEQDVVRHGYTTSQEVPARTVVRAAIVLLMR